MKYILCVAFLLTFLTTFTSVDSVRCYHCSSEHSDNCNDVNFITAISLPVRDCASACMKTEIYSEFDQIQLALVILNLLLSSKFQPGHSDLPYAAVQQSSKNVTLPMRLEAWSIII